MEYNLERIGEDKNFSHYEFSYEELQEDFIRFKNLSDKKFLLFIKKIIHFSIYCCWIKQIPSYYCLSDEGIIHQLVHLMLYPEDYSASDLKNVRKEFNQTLNLAPVINSKKAIIRKERLKTTKSKMLKNLK